MITDVDFPEELRQGMMCGGRETLRDGTICPGGFFHALAERRWGLGLDIGQANDPSAICVMERIVLPIDPADDADWIDPQSRQKLHKPRYTIRHLERLPLGMAYPEQVAYVVKLLLKPPLRVGCTFAIDRTGIGRALFDMFSRDPNLRRLRIPTVGITITSGREDQQDGEGGYHVAKQNLVARIQTAFHERRLKVAPTLKEAPTFVRELQNFMPTVSESTGNVQYGARQGAHDDLLLSAAVILWALHGPSNMGWSVETFLV